ncbi:pseudouridine synthase [Chondrinema litorale]|uniref:pseudouridine synthase n=1 Tax=Chondrinema litorale TaxID=2994555 RepID=UPI002542E585|nr:pseudouridine synthase [Chondrinema litorale]UZR95786.1 pseudouridine synthase [Chondrinema litorale]
MNKRKPTSFRKGKNADNKPAFEKKGKSKPVFKKKNEKFSKPKPPEYGERYVKAIKKEEEEKGSDQIRLNRYIANSGVCSRRDADQLITDGKITVNGKVVKEMGYKVSTTDTVKYQGKLLKRESFVYVLLNKPKGFITTMSDEKGRRTIMDLVSNACEERIYPVGRLDKETTGLIMLTNDGDLAKKLSHPSGKTQKIYHVELDKPISNTDYDTIVHREFELEDGPVDLDGINIISDDRKKLGVELHSGRNRIVRRMFAHFKYEVVKLDRTVFAGLTKLDLPRGNWRYLSEKEVIRLKHFQRV